MRRASWLMLAVALMLVVAAPLAMAGKKQQPAPSAQQSPPLIQLGTPPPPPSRPYVAPTPGDYASSDPPPDASVQPPPPGEPPPPNAPKGGVPLGVVGLVLMGLGGTVTLALSLLAARRARRPKLRKAPRKSFDAGRLVGRASRVDSLPDALDALRKGIVGEVVSVQSLTDGVRVGVKRRRGESCPHAAGYLTGLFESAWATDVLLRHDDCAGKARGGICVYEFRSPSGAAPASAPSPAAVPRAAASIPGSPGGLHRWPPTRPGGA